MILSVDFSFSGKLSILLDLDNLTNIKSKSNYYIILSLLRVIPPPIKEAKMGDKDPTMMEVSLYNPENFESVYKK